MTKCQNNTPNFYLNNYLPAYLQLFFEAEANACCGEAEDFFQDINKNSRLTFFISEEDFKRCTKVS